MQESTRLLLTRYAAAVRHEDPEQGRLERELAAHIDQLREDLALFKAGNHGLGTTVIERTEEAQRLRTALKAISERAHIMTGTPMGSQRQERNIWQEMGRIADKALNPPPESPA